VYTFTKLHDRRIPKVRVGVGVGPMEFKLSYLTPCPYVGEQSIVMIVFVCLSVRMSVHVSVRFSGTT